MRYERDEGNVPGALDSQAQRALVPGADAGASAGLDLGPVGNKPADFIGILVIYDLDVFDAESADAAARNEPASRPSARAPARSSAARAAGRASAGRPRRA